MTNETNIDGRDRRSALRAQRRRRSLAVKKLFEAFGWLTAILILMYASHAVFAQTKARPETDNATTHIGSAPITADEEREDGRPKILTVNVEVDGD
ncbi:MAG: hypothetical protein ACRD68_00780 [Pyrinomonadaceae bacterium]